MSVFLSDPLFDILFLALIGSIAYNFWQIKKRDNTWKQLMADLNFTKNENNNKGRDKESGINGYYRKHKVNLIESNVPVVRNGKSKTDFFSNSSTIIKVDFNKPQENKMSLSRNIPRFGNASEKNDIGIEEVDRVFIVTSEPQDFAKDILLKNNILAEVMKLPGGCLVEVDENGIKYDQSRRMTNIEAILSLFNFLCTLADAIEAN